MTRKPTFRLWQPPSDTIEAIASVLSSHWLAAKSHPETLFWPGPGRWLGEPPLNLSGHGASGARYFASLHRNAWLDT